MSEVRKVEYHGGVSLHGDFTQASNNVVWLTENNARETANRILELTGGNETAVSLAEHNALKQELKMALGQLRAANRQVAALEYDLFHAKAEQPGFVQDELLQTKDGRVVVLIETDGKIRRQEFII